MLYCSFYKHYIDLKLYDSFGVVNNFCIVCVLMRNSRALLQNFNSIQFNILLERAHNRHDPKT